MTQNARILIVVTNVSGYEKAGYRTGLWLGELTHFWDVAEEAGIALDIASPEGGQVPLDPESLSHEVLDEFGTARRYADREFMDLLDDTKRLADVDSDDYDAIYLTGGHGVMFDFTREDLGRLMATFYEQDKVVSTVCHGGVGLLPATLSTGEPLVKGKHVTGFSWPEEEIAARDSAVPFSLQDELRELGADYTIAQQPFDSYVVVDGTLITGQNPGSAREVAQAVVRQLQAG